MTSENLVMDCISKLYFIRTSTMPRALGFGHRYLGFSFPEHKAQQVKTAAYNHIQEQDVPWEYLLVRLLVDDGAYCTDTTHYTLGSLKLEELESTLEKVFENENLSCDGLYAWVARPCLDDSVSIKNIAEEIEQWFIKDWFKPDMSALKLSNFKITETRAPAINKLLKAA